jgi:hypothetical protein
LKSGGLFGAFVSALGERRKERTDFRRILPQSGITGAAFQKVFGRPYRYGSSGGTMRTIGGGSTTDSSPAMTEKITRLGITSTITAKNTSVLPMMARDMNIMRQNMQKMVKLSGGTPTNKADMFFKRSLERESIYESRFKKEGGSALTPVASSQSSQATTSMFGGIGSIFSSIASTFGSVAGGLLSGLTNIFSKIGVVGMIAFVGVGWLIKQLFENVDFGSLGKSFGEVGTALKKFFTGEGAGEKGILQATKDNFNELWGSIKKVGDQFGLMWEAIKLQTDNLKDLFNDLGGGFGILGLALGAGVASKVVARWVPSLIGLAATPAGLVAALVGATGYGIYKLGESISNMPTDNVPVTPEEEAAASRAATGRVDPMYLRRQREREEARINSAKNRIAEYEQRIAELEQGTQSPAVAAQIKSHRATIEGLKSRIGSTTSPSRSSSPDITNDMRRGRGYEGESPERISSSLPADKQAMADLIYSKFIAAGFSDAQAKGAIANAYAESRLNPSAYYKTNTEESVGLFQANRNGGLGTNYSVEQLKDPNFNIDLVIAKAKNSPKFIAATTPEEATRAFMLEVERPKNRTEIAQLDRIKNLNQFSVQTAGNLPGPVAASPAATPVPAASQKGSIVDSLSTQISNMTNEFLSGFREGAGAPPIINNTNITNGGTSAPTASVRDERLTEEQFRNLHYPQAYA